MPSKKPLPLKFIAPPIVLMTLVFLIQLFLSNLSVLSRWKGGGFGMFSDISDTFYHIHIHKSYTHKVDCAEFPATFGLKQKKLKYFPANYLIHDLLKELTTHKWAYYTKYSRKQASKKGIRMIMSWEKTPNVIKYINPSFIEIEIWETSFNQKTMSVQPKKIRSIKEAV